MLIKAATHLRPILRLGVIQNPSSIPTTSTLGPNAFTSNSTLSQLSSVSGSLTTTPAQNALANTNPQHPGSSGGSNGSWNAGSSGSSSGGKFGERGYSGYARAFVNGSSSSGSGGLVGQLQSYQDEGRLVARRGKAGSEDERIRVLKEGRPLLRVVDVDAQERRRITAFASASGPTSTDQSRKVTIVDVSEAMTVQSLAALTTKRAQQQAIDREDTISIDGDEDVIVERTPKTRSINRAGSFTARVPADRSLWTVGIRAGPVRKIAVPVTAAQPIRLLTTSAPRPTLRSHGKSVDDSTLLEKSSLATRRNSTASAVRPSTQPTELTEAEQAMRKELNERDDKFAQRITQALERGDHAETMKLVNAYRSQESAADQNAPPYYTARTYNVILSALQAFRQPGEPISTILTTYNEMLERDVLPTIATYGLVIQVLLERDDEVDRAVKRVSRKRRWSEWERTVTNKQGGGSSNRRNAQLEQEEQELEQLSKENNYESAIKLFRAAIVYNRYRPFRVAAYISLLGAAARRGDVETAIQVWGHHEGVKNSAKNLEQQSSDKIDVRPTTRMFTLLMQAYANARELSGIQEVLQEFLEQERHGRIMDGRGQQPIEESMRYVQGLFTEVLHAHIAGGSPDVALQLLDEMAEISTEDAAQPGSLPQVSSNMVARCVFAFATNGDFERALQLTTDIQAKFANALTDDERKSALSQSLEYIINEAISNSNVEVLTKAIDMLPSASENNTLRDDAANGYAVTLLRAINLLATVRPPPVQTVLSLLHASDSPEIKAQVSLRSGVVTIIQECLSSGDFGAARTVLEFFDKPIESRAGAIHELVREYWSQIVDTAADFESALQTSAVLARYGASPSRSDALKLIYQYRDAPTQDLVWSPEQVSALISVFEVPASAVHRDSLQGEDAREYDLVLDRLIRDMGAAVSAGIDIGPANLERLLNVLSSRKGDQSARSMMLETFGPDAVAPLVEPTSPNLASENGSDAFPAVSETSTAPTSVAPTYHIDRRLTSAVDAHYGARPTSNPLASYAALKQGLTKGVVAEPVVIGRLAQALARMGEESKVRELYALAHDIIATSVPQERQLDAWVQVEDYMLIATCHLGHLEQAGMHRARIIEQGMAPSADAYATMISSTKDTTDDASVARELWEESQRYNVKPHLYLYNTIISKLSKARKAEAALDFFKNMKAEGLRPSSVTYGAVINACVRVGDVESATTLFQEMQDMPNFKPRVPPYNTMMQMHLQTQPSRELVLHYYNQMIQANVAPSAHTYKLLLDAYGTLEPIDLDAMQKIFDNLCKDRRVEVQGTHWASLIHAYGNVAGQPEKAIEIFESIPSHPATRSKDIEPVCWEAILNVLASAKMTDRMEEYVSRMQRQHVRPTAYINNMLIRGYASVGKVDKSREIFESMQDAVTGVAAPNNHPALLTSSGQAKPLTVAQTDNVFREPSTYEAMIRAELNAGNREAASALCDRLESRMYPVAVTSRIRSLIDDPNSPSAGLRS